MQSPYNGGGYPGPPQPSSGMSSLTIVLLILGAVLVLGGGACAVGALFVFGAVASEPAGAKPAPMKPGRPPATEPAEPADEPDPDDDPAEPAAPSAKPAKAAPVGPPAPGKKGRTVDFVCPPGKPPAGTVRAGCMCGSEILGTACGSGGFTDVVATAKGCRFTCD